MVLRLCIAGATGWTGSALVKAIAQTPDMQLVGAVARKAAGQDIGEALGVGPLGVRVSADVAAALATPTDVLIEYTAPDVAKSNILQAIAHGVAVIVGTSGLTQTDYAEIGQAAQAAGVGVIAAGNFSITAALLKHFATVAAQFVAQWEIIDYAGHSKVDAPSGTAYELATTLGAIHAPRLGLPLAAIHGLREARGATVSGVQVHSVRLPGYVIGVEAIFGENGERLSIRHDAGDSAQPYIAGTFLAARQVRNTVGLTQGFDTLLFPPTPAKATP